jgi:SAM-dependent methyltransferase
VTAPKIFTPEYYARMRENEAGGWWNAAMRDVAGRLLAEAEMPTTGVLLDVGCGSGQTMAWFQAAHRGWRTIGLDLSEDALRAAQQTRPGEVIRASALALPVGDASVNTIITLDVLQHLPLDGGDRRALAEMRRVLVPGGWLFIRTNAQMYPKSADDPVHLFHRYEPEELRAKLVDVGFMVRRVGRLNALLGLAEIPRDLEARRADASSYHGILSTPTPEGRWPFAIKRGWLRFEGDLVARGLTMPFGKTIVALCQSPDAATGR